MGGGGRRGKGPHRRTDHLSGPLANLVKALQHVLDALLLTSPFPALAGELLHCAGFFLPLGDHASGSVGCGLSYDLVHGLKTLPDNVIGPELTFHKLFYSVSFPGSGEKAKDSPIPEGF